MQMSASDNLYRLISTIATPKELSLLAVLHNDHFTRLALAARDMKALSRVYQVSMFSYEDYLKEKHGVIFRNKPGRFEVIQANKPIFSVPDDELGSCGNAVVLSLKQRDDSRLPAHYPTAMSGKYRPNPDDVLTNVDADSLFGVSGQVRKGWPLTIAAVDRFDELMKCAPLDRSDYHSMELVNVLCQIYTILRGTGKECHYEDTRRTSQMLDVAGMVALGKASTGDYTIVPAARGGSTTTDSDSDSDEVETGKFTKAERKLVKMLFKPAGFEKHTDDEGEYFVKSKRSLFSLVGSKFIDLGELPVWAPVETPGSPQRGLDVAGPPPAVTEGVRYSAACGLVQDYKGVDMNRYKDVRALLVLGGLSEQARDLFGGFSHAKKMTFLRPVSGRMTFDRAVEAVAEKLGVQPTEALAEVVASKLILAKGAVKFVEENGSLYVEK